MEGAEEAEVQPAQPSVLTVCVDGEVGVWLVCVRRPRGPRVWWRFEAAPFGADGGRGVLTYDGGLTEAECRAVAAGRVEVRAVAPYTGQRRLSRYEVAVSRDLTCGVPPGVAPSVLALALTGLAGAAAPEEATMALLRRKECVGRRLTRRGSDEVRICVDVDSDQVVCALVDPATGGPRSGKRARLSREEVVWLADPPKEPEAPKERSPGRPHLSVSASLPRELADQLAAFASERSQSQSTVIREAVEAYLHPAPAPDLRELLKVPTCEVQAPPEAPPAPPEALPTPVPSREEKAAQRAQEVVEEALRGAFGVVGVSGPLVRVWRGVRALEAEIRVVLGGQR